MIETIALLQADSALPKLTEYGIAGILALGLIALFRHSVRRDEYWQSEFTKQEQRHQAAMDTKDSRITTLTAEALALNRETVRVLEMLENTMTTIRDEIRAGKTSKS